MRRWACWFVPRSPDHRYARTNPAAQNITQNAGPQQQQQGDIALTLEVCGFSVRKTFPARVVLQCAVPRTTATVDALAACVEDAWVAWGGARGKVAWGRMLRGVGAVVGGGRILTDADVRAWVGRAGAREEGRMAA